MRFLVRTTLLALSLTYAANWLFFRNGDSREVRVDCGLYSAGQGLGPDGKPFQVTLSCDIRDIYKFFQSLEDFYPYYLCEHTKPTTKLIHVVATFNALSLWGKSAAGPWSWSLIGLGLLQVMIVSSHK